jgi:DNA-binding transcriptional MerR regulator
MPTRTDLSLQDLAAVADVTPRTIRYYIAQGLLPAPEGAGPGARYGDAHLARLRLIRQLQREHLPLAEIRSRLTGLDDAAIADLVARPLDVAAPTSAIDYVRGLLAGSGRAALSAQPQRLSPSQAPPAMSLPAAFMPPAATPGGEADAPSALSKPSASQSGLDRSQWDRIALGPDVELHVRRPLGRLQNRRVDRLIVIARELLEEDQS